VVVEVDDVVVLVELVVVVSPTGMLEVVVVAGVEVVVVSPTGTLEVVVAGCVVVVVVVGREGGGGSGKSSMGRSGNPSCEQSTGTPVSPSTKLQYSSWQAVSVVLDKTTVSNSTAVRGLPLGPLSLIAPPSAS
jgi:hypothetical protein